MAHIFLYELQDFPFHAPIRFAAWNMQGLGNVVGQRLRPNRYTLSVYKPEAYNQIFGGTHSNFQELFMAKKNNRAPYFETLTAI